MCALAPNLLLFPIGPIHGAYPVFKYLNLHVCAPLHVLKPLYPKLRRLKKKKIPYPEPMFHVPFDESFSVYPMTPFLIQNIYKPYCGSLTNDFEGHIHPQ